MSKPAAFLFIIFAFLLGGVVGGLAQFYHQPTEHEKRVAAALPKDTPRHWSFNIKGVGEVHVIEFYPKMFKGQRCIYTMHNRGTQLECFRDHHSGEHD